MSQSVNYLVSGNPHLPYLVVSLYTLRRYWGGKINVFAWPESFDLVETICSDDRIGATAVERVPEYRGKNSQFFDKIRLMRSLDEDYSSHLYLDADTKVCGKINELLDRAQTASFCATQFCNWRSNSGAPKNRIMKLIGRKPIDQTSVDLLLKYPMSSLNGGVFACKARSPVLKVWEEWTGAVLDLFIADETVLHAVQVEFATTGEFDVAVGGKWNCSPKYKPEYLHDDDVVIWHNHGDGCCRPQKTQKGYDQWWPTYKRCLAHNIGHIQDWIKTINNKHLSSCSGWDQW